MQYTSDSGGDFLNPPDTRQPQVACAWFLKITFMWIRMYMCISFMCVCVSVCVSVCVCVCVHVYVCLCVYPHGHK